MLLVLLVVVGVWLFYRNYTAIYKKWERRGFHIAPTTFPFGSSFNLAMSRKFMGHSIDEMYNNAAPHPYFVYFNMRSPTLVLRDPEMIGLVMAKEFSHFRDRKAFKIPKDDVLGNNLFNLEGERWRGLRVKLSPTFTSGKLKGMFQHFITCAEGLDNLLLSKAGSSLDVKDVISRFNVDIITSCAFGLEGNAINDNDSPFRKLARRFFNVTPRMKYQLALGKAFPFMLKLSKPRFTSKFEENFLLNMVTDTVEHREKNNLQRNDFLDLLIQLKNKGSVVDDTSVDKEERPAQPVEMTIQLLTAQAFVFFFAGFETASSVQSFCLYELALHPEIQDRLGKEIDSTISKHKDLTYQAIMEMEYLDMVISETVRKYPTLMYMTRSCTKDFTTPGGHRIEKGDRIIIPVWSLHHDPGYFHNPDKFDPERFSQENKAAIVPYTYLPFGEGPRICIGMRFGLLQTKVGLITVLRRYKLEPSEETEIPLELSRYNALLTTTKGPISVRLTKREL